MDKLFQMIDRGINQLMRTSVVLSLAFLAVIAWIAWPAHGRMGVPLYVAGFVVCGLSAVHGKRILVAVSRRIIPRMMGAYAAAPPWVEVRVRTLLMGANHQAVGIRMPTDKKANKRFLLSILEGGSRGIILISERVLECRDEVLRMMLGHEIGHLHDPPERSAPRNDAFLFWWCIWLAHAGAPLGVLLAAFAVRIAAVGFARMIECWMREVRADLYGAFIFGGPDGLRQFERVFDEIDRATEEGKLLREAEKQPQNWTGSVLFAGAICFFFPTFAAFAAINLGSKVLFALLPTTHPPVRQRRDLAHRYVQLASQAS